MHASMHCVATSYTVLLSGKVFFFLLLVSVTLLVTQKVKKKNNDRIFGNGFRT